MQEMLHYAELFLKQLSGLIDGELVLSTLLLHPDGEYIAKFPTWIKQRMKSERWTSYLRASEQRIRQNIEVKESNVDLHEESKEVSEEDEQDDKGHFNSKRDTDGRPGIVGNQSVLLFINMCRFYVHPIC